MSLRGDSGTKQKTKSDNGSLEQFKRMIKIIKRVYIRIIRYTSQYERYILLLKQNWKN